MNQNKLINKFNIIAGQYGGRKLTFTGDKTLRPTPNRVRETLFNWLAFELAGKNVLDAFAGSGALGFEACSRGVDQVVLIEKNYSAFLQIQRNIKLLNATNMQVIHRDIFTINDNTTAFDYIFLDPPFFTNMIDKTLIFLLNNNFINDETYIYIESEYLIANRNLRIIKQKKTASVFYCLVKII